MHNRYYAPRLAHFLTPDFRLPSILDPTTFKEPYAYATGNPITYWDPTGLDKNWLFEQLNEGFKNEIFMAGLTWGVVRNTFEDAWAFLNFAIQYHDLLKASNNYKLYLRWGKEPTPKMLEDHQRLLYIQEEIKVLILEKGIFTEVGKEFGAEAYDGWENYKQGDYWHAGENFAGPGEFLLGLLIMPMEKLATRAASRVASRSTRKILVEVDVNPQRRFFDFSEPIGIPDTPNGNARVFAYKESWALNSNNFTRDVQGVLDLLEEVDIQVPDYIKVRTGKPVVNKAYAEFFSSQPNMNGGFFVKSLDKSFDLKDRFHLDYLFDDDGFINVTLSNEILNSDDAIVSVMVHELHEIDSFLNLFGDNNTFEGFHLQTIWRKGFRSFHTEANSMAGAFFEQWKGLRRRTILGDGFYFNPEIFPNFEP